MNPSPHATRAPANPASTPATPGWRLEHIGLRRGSTQVFDGLNLQLAEPRIGLLTPGRFNASYAEQAHLARYLGFLLVEGADLAAIDDQLYVGIAEIISIATPSAHGMTTYHSRNRSLPVESQR